jgi:predicted glycosyltransferase
MKILVDIIHPAHVHFFRNAIALWKKKYEVLVTSREKDITLELLGRFGIENKCLSIRQNGIL